MNISMLALRLREKISKFSGVISSGLGKVAGRFIGDLIYGIQASQSVVLSDAGRVLEEVTLYEMDLKMLLTITLLLLAPPISRMRHCW